MDYASQPPPDDEDLISYDVLSASQTLPPPPPILDELDEDLPPAYDALDIIAEKLKSITTTTRKLEIVKKGVSRKVRPPTKKPPAFEMQVNFTRDKPAIPPPSMVRLPSQEDKGTLLSSITQFNTKVLKRTNTVVKFTPIELPPLPPLPDNTPLPPPPPLDDYIPPPPIIDLPSLDLNFNSWDTNLPPLPPPGDLPLPPMPLVGGVEAKAPPKPEGPQMTLQITSPHFTFKTKVQANIIVGCMMPQIEKKLPPNVKYQPFCNGKQMDSEKKLSDYAKKGATEMKIELKISKKEAKKEIKLKVTKKK